MICIVCKPLHLQFYLFFFLVACVFVIYLFVIWGVICGMSASLASCALRQTMGIWVSKAQSSLFPQQHLLCSHSLVPCRRFAQLCMFKSHLLCAGKKKGEQVWDLQETLLTLGIRGMAGRHTRAPGAGLIEGWFAGIKGDLAAHIGASPSPVLSVLFQLDELQESYLSSP